MRSFTHTASGIDWYCEQRGEGPTVVLVPSGEGDCAAFERTAAALAADFTVLTFDTPGFSRTSTPADPQDISMYRLGAQIAGLVESLGIGRATFYGCSSGAVAVLDLVRDFPGIVRNVVIHEAAGIGDSATAGGDSPLRRMLALDDAGIVAFCKPFFGSVFNENSAAWDALGTDYHARLERNYVTWVRQYVAKVDARQVDPATLARKPIAWTIGGLNPAAMFFGNLKVAWHAGIEPSLLPCKHFPQVSIPDVLAAHIRQSTLPYLDCCADGADLIVA